LNIFEREELNGYTLKMLLYVWTINLYTHC